MGAEKKSEKEILFVLPNFFHSLSLCPPASLDRTKAHVKEMSLVNSVDEATPWGDVVGGII